ncbi:MULTISPECIES: hypothetical protein [Pseudoalteromonas]|uniref:hypothetical protein n=1 Tax=Pseudoalteromonas TaxID=53246 RepID=UPI0002F5E72E|nr:MULTISPECIES: hypothetical protein [Pseudoalteromonas]MCF6146570.1 hypothetical protein [Pseudoalteromonas mariniglutinosa NCIMB 1770]
MNRVRLISLKTLIVTVLFLFVGFFWWAGNISAPSGNTKITTFIDTSVRCQTTSSANKNVLIVYVPIKAMANDVTNVLCDDAVVAKQYGEVTTYWGNKSSDTIDFLGKGIADLILAKENLMDAFMAQTTYNYKAVVGFPSYTAFIISSKEKPKIEKQYFLDKRIGLLDYPTSRSGHILPKQMFKQLDINMDNLTIVYASSHQELRELLATGSVDLISSYWQDSDQTLFSRNYITPISDNISGSRWYLKMQSENTDLLCAVQERLISLLKEQNSQYFNHVESYWQCDGQSAHFVGQQK